MSQKTISVTLVLLLLTLVAQTSFAEKLSIEPQKIVLNDSSRNDTIQANITLQISSEISDFEATISFNGQGAIEATGYNYCEADEVLHIYFSQKEVIKFLSDNNISGKVTVTVSGSLTDGLEKVTFSGEDKIEVVESKEDTNHQKGKDTKDPPKKGKD